MLIPSSPGAINGMRLTEQQLLLQQTARTLMQRHAPREVVRELDETRAYPYDLHRAWADAGFFALAFPEADGGLGGSVADLMVVGEEISYASPDLFMAFAGNVFCGLNVSRKGSPEQRARWLPKLIAGEIRMAICMSEPNAGSDVGAIETAARREGEGWRINGQKLWSTGAGARSTLLNIYLRTDAKASYRDALSLMLVENDAEGVELRRLDMIGRRATGTYEIFLRDVYADDSRVVGGVNKGWACAMSGLEIERIVSCASNIGASRAVVDLASAYAAERRQFGRPIGANQAIAHMLADMATEVEAGRALTMLAAEKLAAGEDALREITMAKLFTSEAYVKVASQGMQIMGAYGCSMEYDMQRHYRDCRSATIAAGSSQMQRNLIARLMGHVVR